MELAHQLSRPNGPYPKSQVARALGLAHATLYLHSKQAVKDKQVAIAIEQWHELDDTLGHRKLAVLLGMGKVTSASVSRNDSSQSARSPAAPFGRSALNPLPEPSGATK